MTEKMKIGILGCGVISRVYVRDMLRLYSGELEIAAVADLHPEAARSLAEEYSLPRVCTPEELLADPDVELIVNLTPPRFHAELNLRLEQKKLQMRPPRANRRPKRNRLMPLTTI